MPCDQGEAQTELDRGDRRADRPVHPTRRSRPHSFRLWPRVHSAASQGLDRSRRCQNRLHRAGITLGERLLRKLQCSAPRRTAQRRGRVLTT